MLSSTGETVSVSPPLGVPVNPIPSVYTFPLAEILLGIELASNADPPLRLSAKSLASKDPLPLAELYTASLMVTAIVELSLAKETDDTTGSVPSYAQVNWLAAVFAFPAASVNLFAPRSIVTAPSALGVKVAV